MAVLSAVLSLGFVSLRPSRLSFSSFNSLRQQTSLLRRQSLVLSRSPLNRVLQASRQSNYANAAEAETTSPGDRSEIVFLGTGTSEGIPRVSCLTNPLKTCSVCTKAAEPGNKNRRLNTSILVRYTRPSGTSNILIDCGKFFYHSALKWFPTFGLRTLDAVVITHSHADAIGGL